MSDIIGGEGIEVNRQTDGLNVINASAIPMTQISGLLAALTTQNMAIDAMEKRQASLGRALIAVLGAIFILTIVCVVLVAVVLNR